MEEKITIAICNYNHNKYLKQSIESIVNQSYKNLEIIVVDDCSKDNPKEIVESINDNRIKYIQIDKNYGKWNALNVAIDVATSNIITSHDADDVSLPNRIERQYRCLKETNTVHNLCGFYHCWNNSDIEKYCLKKEYDDKIRIIDPSSILNFVLFGYNSKNINHYYTGDFETAGTSAMFYKKIWDFGIRFNPPGVNLRVLNSEDSDFNFRTTVLLNKTSILAEQQYCYRRNTSTNNEDK